MARRRLLRAIGVSPERAHSDPAAAFNIYKFVNYGVGLLRSQVHTSFFRCNYERWRSALAGTSSAAQNSGFRNAPPSAAEMKNPYTSASAAAAGKKLYVQNCAQCHGSNLQRNGTGTRSSTARAAKNAKPGELFWFITKGKLESGMPSWANLPQQQRWQIVTFLQSQDNTKAAAK